MENTLASVDLGRYRRIVQMFWDPEPTNDAALDQPVWCLGRSYKLGDRKSPAQVHVPVSTPKRTTENITSYTDDKAETPTPYKSEQGHIKQDLAPPASNAPNTPPESASSSVSSSLAYDDPVQEGRWPQGFLEDFESKFWMTYRSEFEAIRRSSDPKATTSLSLAMRIKAQLGDQSGFSSDTGWGCMIRSGQSLLANAIAMLRLGRDWRRGSLPQDECELIRMFADDPRAPYSIHKFVQHGATACGKYPGEWFGPSATARCIQ